MSSWRCLHLANLRRDKELLGLSDDILQETNEDRQKMLVRLFSEKGLPMTGGWHAQEYRRCTERKVFIVSLRHLLNFAV